MDEEQTRVGDSEGELEVVQQQRDEAEALHQRLSAELAEKEKAHKALEQRLSDVEAQAEQDKQAWQQAESSLSEKQSATAASLDERTAALEQSEAEREVASKNAAALLSAWQQSVKQILDAMPREKEQKTALQDAVQASEELKELIHEASGDQVRSGIAEELSHACQRLLRNYNDVLNKLSSEKSDHSERAEQLQTRSQVLESELAELQEQIESIQSERAQFEAEATQFREQAEQEHQESQTLHKELSALREEHGVSTADLAAAQTRLEELEATLETKSEVEKQLSDTTEDLERTRHRMTDAEDAAQQLIRSIKDLGMHSTDLYDQLGLLSPGASRRFDRTTQSLTKASTEGVPMQVAEYGSELLKRIMDQISDMHRDLRDTRQQHFADEERIGQLDNNVKEQTSLAEQLKQGRDSFERELQEAQLKVTTLGEEKESVEKQLKDHQELFEQHSQQKAAMMEELRDDLDEALASQEALQEQFDLEAERVMKQLEEAEQGNQKLSNTIEEMQAEITAQRAEAASTELSLQQGIDEREDTINNFMHEIDQLKEERLEVRGLEARIRTLNDKLSDANRDIVRMQKEVDAAARAREEAASLHVSVKELQSERDKHVRSTRKLERQLAEEKARSQSLKKARDKQQQDSVRKIERVNQDIQQERERREALQEEARQLKRELAGLRARARTADSSRRKTR